MKAFDSAVWIWNSDADGDNVYVNFDGSFTLGSAGNCRIRISCDRNYSLTLNGSFVDCGQYSDYEDLKFYDELDLSGFAKSGENSFSITVYHQGSDSSTYKRGKAGLIFEIYSGGRTVYASSEDTSTYINRAYADGTGVEWVSGQLGYSFSYDSTVRNGTPERAVRVDKTYDIQPRPVEKLRILPPAECSVINRGSFTDTRKSGTPAQFMQDALLRCDTFENTISLPAKGEKLTSDGDGIFLIADLGSENTGILSLGLEVPHDCMIYIGWGEHLADLRVRTRIGERNFAASYKAHAGRNTFENPFLRLGLRYLQLHIYAESCTLYYAGIRPTLYPLDKIVNFNCADHLHNRIYEAAVRTLRLCMHEHYEDCPWREQSLYSMDSRNQMLCGYYAFGETRFARASIELMAHSIRGDNMLELCSPATITITIPSFSAIFLVQLYEYLEFSGDTDFAARMLPVAERIAGELIRRTDPDTGLIHRFEDKGYWNFYEWQNGLSGSTSGDIPERERAYDAPLNAFVSLGLRSLADIAGRLGDSGKAEYYRTRGLELNRSMQSFYDAERGCYASYIKDGTKSHYCELTNSLMVCADAVGSDRLGGVLAAIAGGKLTGVTLSHSIFKYDALMRDMKYARYVFGDIADKWGSMLSEGATAFWETIEGQSAFGNAGSLCHGWSAIPVYIYHRYALGADPKLTGVYEAKAGEPNDGE